MRMVVVMEARSNTKRTKIGAMTDFIIEMIDHSWSLSFEESPQCVKEKNAVAKCGALDWQAKSGQTVLCV